MEMEILIKYGIEVLLYNERDINEMYWMTKDVYRIDTAVFTIGLAVAHK